MSKVMVGGYSLSPNLVLHVQAGRPVAPLKLALAAVFLLVAVLCGLLISFGMGVVLASAIGLWLSIEFALVYVHRHKVRVSTADGAIMVLPCLSKEHRDATAARLSGMIPVKER